MSSPPSGGGGPRLLGEAPGRNSGVTFCQGKSLMAGDDLVANIRDYGDRIFMFHDRDSAAGLAWTVGCMRALDQTIEV